MRVGIVGPMPNRKLLLDTIREKISYCSVEIIDDIPDTSSATELVSKLQPIPSIVIQNMPTERLGILDPKELIMQDIDRLLAIPEDYRINLPDKKGKKGKFIRNWEKKKFWEKV